MRLAIVNDDMPFLVDSVAAALAANRIDIHRLLHPVLPVRRDGSGRLTAVLAGAATGERRRGVGGIGAGAVRCPTLQQRRAARIGLEGGGAAEGRRGGRAELRLPRAGRPARPGQDRSDT